MSAAVFLLGALVIASGVAWACVAAAGRARARRRRNFDPEGQR